MKALDELMRSVRDMAKEDAPGVTSAPAVPDLLLYAPCPVKLLVKDGIDRIAADHARRGRELRVHIPMGCTSVDPYDPIYRESDPDRLPGVIGSIGFGDFWRREFVSRHVRAGLFSAAPAVPLSPLHERAGLLDPRGHYTLYGVTPYLFLVDTRRLGDLPVPQAWEDVLHPRYKGELIMCGDGDDMADAVILNVYKEFGMDGLHALAANCKGFMHSSSMVKSAGSGDESAGAVYIIPAFFAETVTRPAHLRVVWPRDGAASSPLYFLAKKSERERLADVIAFFADGFLGIDSAAWFVPMAASAAVRLPPEASLKWVGWDWIEDNDVTERRDTLNVLFRDMVRKATCA
ncbi:MAG: ABC transporter substrate-binding protein [Desulfovibrionaceae bacterium]|nr:ABC transporter substrate-binding protein [Desulfovibrionaceae bacterium]